MGSVASVVSGVSLVKHTANGSGVQLCRAMISLVCVCMCVCIIGGIRVGVFKAGFVGRRGPTVHIC